MNIVGSTSSFPAGTAPGPKPAPSLAAKKEAPSPMPLFVPALPCLSRDARTRFPPPAAAHTVSSWPYTSLLSAPAA